MKLSNRLFSTKETLILLSIAIIIIGALYLLACFWAKKRYELNAKNTFVEEENNIMPKVRSVYLKSPIESVEIRRQGMLLKGELLEEFVKAYTSLGKSKLRKDPYGPVSFPAPDFSIVITFTDGTKKEYALVSRAVLIEFAPEPYFYGWQFPFGTKLYEAFEKFEQSNKEK